MRLTVSLRFSPGAGLRVGTLFDLGRDMAFEYDRAFLATGLDIAPFRPPPQRGVVVYDRSGNMDTFGVFEDSLPDGWQTLSVAGEGANPTQRDLDRLAHEVGLLI